MNTGRPTKYDETLNQEADKYLESCQDVEVPELAGLSAKGTELYKKKLKVNLPTIEGFAIFIGVNPDTLYEWAKKYPEFSESLRKIKIEQKKRLLNSGLSGDYNSTIAKLILSSNHDMKEKQDITSDNEAIKGNEIIFRNFKEGSDNAAGG